MAAAGSPAERDQAPEENQDQEAMEILTSTSMVDPSSSSAGKKTFGHDLNI